MYGAALCGRRRLDLMQGSSKLRGEASLIAADWGTSRFRAYLIDCAGLVLEEVSSEEGISALSGEGFSQVLMSRCGAWLEAYPKLPVLMAGMIGSRNGWQEVPYVACPASPSDIRAGVREIEITQGRMAGIVPGLIHREAGVADVIRGEETQILGAGLENGLMVLPGTHSKWARIEGGRIASFKTFMTGEFYALLREQSVLRLLAAEPGNHSGFRRGLAAAQREGGILHQAFAARTTVLDGQMAAAEVGPFISGLLIAHEIAGATEFLDSPLRVTVVAEGEIARNYEEALAQAGARTNLLAPRACFVQGMLRLTLERSR
jgi:2-dehydro-3-deoxygalactonokinase